MHEFRLVRLVSWTVSIQRLVFEISLFRTNSEELFIQNYYVARVLKTIMSLICYEHPNTICRKKNLWKYLSYYMSTSNDLVCTIFTYSIASPEGILQSDIIYDLMFHSLLNYHNPLCTVLICFLKFVCFFCKPLFS